jgi:hypothetical protein
VVLLPGFILRVWLSANAIIAATFFLCISFVLAAVEGLPNIIFFQLTPLCIPHSERMQSPLLRTLDLCHGIHYSNRNPSPLCIVISLLGTELLKSNDRLLLIIYISARMNIWSVCLYSSRILWQCTLATWLKNISFPGLERSLNLTKRSKWIEQNGILAFEILLSVCCCHQRNPNKYSEDTARYLTA